MSIFTTIKTILTTPGLMLGGIALLSAIALGGALMAEHVFGLQPCVLCLYQRIPYAITACLGVAGYFMISGEKHKTAIAFIGLCGLIFMANAALAFYHTGVEQHWWVSALEGCKVDFNNDTTNTDALLSAIEKAKAVPCDQIPWVDPVIGLSMAAWNAILCLLLSDICFLSGILIHAKQKSTET